MHLRPRAPRARPSRAVCDLSSQPLPLAAYQSDYAHLLPLSATGLVVVWVQFQGARQRITAKLQQYSSFVPHPALLLPILNGIGEREPGFKASITEYSAYEDLRKAFMLRYAHCRSAFTRGGILWRLCYDDLSPSQLDHGPCGLPPNQRQVSYNGLDYYEDYLTPDEEDLVVGMYKVRNCEYIMCHVYHCDLTPSAVTTGAASYQDYSWWPKQSTWEASGLNVGYWSSGAEDWYQRRLHAIRNNVQPPYNASKWASNLKFLKGDLAKITHTLEDLTSSHLDNIV